MTYGVFRQAGVFRTLHPHLRHWMSVALHSLRKPPIMRKVKKVLSQTFFQYAFRSSAFFSFSSAKLSSAGGAEFCGIALAFGIKLAFGRSLTSRVDSLLGVSFCDWVATAGEGEALSGVKVVPDRSLVSLRG